MSDAPSVEELQGNLDDALESYRAECTRHGVTRGQRDYAEGRILAALVSFPDPLSPVRPEAVPEQFNEIRRALKSQDPRNPPDKSKPPHGYMPFQFAARGDDPRWVCATPFADDTDGLLYGRSHGDDAWEHDADHLASNSRICRTYAKREDAVAACWAHADRWWDGEPPKCPAVSGYRELPPNYAIFVDTCHSVWYVRPDGTMSGEISSDSLWSGLRCYADDCWKEYNASLEIKSVDDAPSAG